MAITIKITGVDDQGFETSLSTTVPDLEEEGTKDYFRLQSYVGALKLQPRAATHVPDSFSGAASSSADLSCQFCGTAVKGIEKFGNMKSDMSAEEVAKGRAEKMGKMGKTAKPVCGKCWSQGGHAKAWEEFYNANKRGR